MNFSAVDQDENETLERLQRGVTIVGVLRGRIVATGTVNPQPVRGRSNTYRALDTAHFGQFAVEPSLQGNGIGGELWVRLEAAAKEAGKTFMACDTAAPAEHLIAYYRARGYEIVERVQWRDKTYESEILRKPLV